jgi:UDP-3-O-[3-hydroxymyristoyl] glucosamine N-acyltransferase
VGGKEMNYDILKNDIHESFKCGDGCAIGSFNVIGENVKIGKNVKIGHHCIIEENVTLGDNVILQAHIKIASGTVVEDNCILKHGTILTNNALLKKNVFMGPNTITLGGTHKSKTIHGTVIGENCYVGASAHIAAGVQICDNVTLGVLSFANKDITEPGIYVGVPVKFLKSNK